MWEVLPVAAVPLYFAHRAYCSHVSQIEYEHRSLEAIESLDQGMSVIDGSGLVTLWNHALEHMVGCPRERALGRPLLDALPVLRTAGCSERSKMRSTHQSPRTQLLYGVLSAAARGSSRCSILPGRWQHDAAVARRDRAEARGVRRQAK